MPYNVLTLVKNIQKKYQQTITDDITLNKIYGELAASIFYFCVKLSFSGYSFDQKPTK